MSSFKVIDSGLVKPDAPHSWAVVSNGVFQSVHVPIRPDGSVENGSAMAQAETTFADMQAALEAAGAAIDDVTLVQIYLTSLEHKPAVDEVYLRYFKPPYPVRVCIAVSELPTAGTVIEMVVSGTLAD